MAKTEETKQLEKQLWKATRKQGTFGCHEVTIGFYGKERVDYMTFDTSGIFRCFEIKVSVSDFHSTSKNTFIGHYNYYVMPQEIYEKVESEIPAYVGVYSSYNGVLSCVKKPKKQVLMVDEVLLKDSMIRSLYREYEKFLFTDDKENLENLKFQISRLKTELSKQYKADRDLSILRYKIRRKYGSEALYELEDMNL